MSVEIYGNVVMQDSPISLFKADTYKATIQGKKSVVLDLRDKGIKTPVNIAWLTSASKEYHISKNIKDYVLAPVPAVTTDIPNRNNQAFPLDKLTAFDPVQGCLRYKTFIGKPTHVEHVNKDNTKAKGIILDAVLVPVVKYGVAKIIVLAAFDRTKDDELATSILRGESNAYSMGAVTTYFSCSVCGGILGPDIKRTCTCKETNYTNLRSYGNIIRGRLHYILAEEPTFIELSKVVTPADITALGDIL